MDQAHWLKLADARLAEAQALLAVGLYAGAYYLAGYAVECRLKALVVRLVENDPGIVFREGGFQADVRTHDFKRLLKRLNLEAPRDLDCRADLQLLHSWDVVFAWSESTRYGFADEPAARELLGAVADPMSGVIQWIDKHF